MNALLVSLYLLTANGQQVIKVKVQTAPVIHVVKKDEMGTLAKVSLTSFACAIIGTIVGTTIYDIMKK